MLRLTKERYSLTPAWPRASTSAGGLTILRAKLVIPRVDAHVFVIWHAELGADGKDYRANFVHAPFFRKF